MLLEESIFYPELAEQVIDYVERYGAVWLDVSRLEEVYGAIAYYLANQATVDAYLNRQSEKWAEGRLHAEPLPVDLRKRLQGTRDQLHTTSPL